MHYYIWAWSDHEMIMKSVQLFYEVRGPHRNNWTNWRQFGFPGSAFLSCSIWPPIFCLRSLTQCSGQWAEERSLWLRIVAKCCDVVPCLLLSRVEVRGLISCFCFSGKWIISNLKPGRRRVEVNKSNFPNSWLGDTLAGAVRAPCLLHSSSRDNGEH